MLVVVCSLLQVCRKMYELGLITMNSIGPCKIYGQSLLLGEFIVINISL